MSDFGSYVISTIQDTGLFPWGQGYARRRKTDRDRRATGVLHELEYKGKVIAKPFTGDRAGASHCVGATLDAFWCAYQRYCNDKGQPFFAGLTARQVDHFHRLWFCGEGVTGARAALTKYGLGRAVGSIDDARPGDFLQFGHSAIFYGWLDEEHTRFAVWESNIRTKKNPGGGITMRSYDTAKFRRKRCYIGRADPPAMAC